MVSQNTALPHRHTSQASSLFLLKASGNSKLVYAWSVSIYLLPVGAIAVPGSTESVGDAADTTGMVVAGVETGVARGIEANRGLGAGAGPGVGARAPAKHKEGATGVHVPLFADCALQK